MKIEQYNVINSGNLGNLIVMVGDLLEDGWQPFGMVVVSSLENKDWYYQTMVKYKDE